MKLNILGYWRVLLTVATVLMTTGTLLALSTTEPRSLGLMLMIASLIPWAASIGVRYGLFQVIHEQFKFSQEMQQIRKPPGSLMLRLAELVVGLERYQLCEAAVADWQEEYFEALDQKRGRWKMAFIRIRHTWGFLKATGLLVLIQYVGKLMSKLAGK